MASRKAVLAALAVLSRAFAGEVDRERAEVYVAALEDLTDLDVQRATASVVKTHTGEFIPPPAVLRAAVRADDPVIDVERIAVAVARLGTYNPHTGWNDPSVRLVRQRMGDAIADACADVGIGRLCSGDDRTRSIAVMEFRRALRDEIKRDPAALPAWANARLGATGARQLTSGGDREEDEVA